MDLPQKIGQLFMFGIEGTEPEPLKPLIEQLLPGGIILFNHNIVSLDQLQKLTGTLQEYAAATGLPPLLISADQEGGRCVRLGEALCPQYPSNRELGDAFLADGNPDAVKQQGRNTAVALSNAGVNMNLAPVLDVVTVEGNTVIADRAYGTEPGVATRLGAAYIEALQANRVIATAKHFPGHGPTHVDSHFGLPMVDLPVAELRAVHLSPFKAAIETGVDAVMPAHIIYTAWDEWPATLSRILLGTLLREELGFRGVVISDDLNMHAISRHYPFPASMVQAVCAGVDILLVCFQPDVQREAWHTVLHAAESGDLSELILDQALDRISRLKAKYLATDTEQ
jgi:beta-N-acetylhexosaminidase